jgi:hypothetical protein
MLEQKFVFHPFYALFLFKDDVFVKLSYRSNQIMAFHRYCWFIKLWQHENAQSKTNRRKKKEIYFVKVCLWKNVDLMSLVTLSAIKDKKNPLKTL